MGLSSNIKIQGFFQKRLVFFLSREIRGKVSDLGVNFGLRFSSPIEASQAFLFPEAVTAKGAN